MRTFGDRFACRQNACEPEDNHLPAKGRGLEQILTLQPSKKPPPTNNFLISDFQIPKLRSKKFLLSQPPALWHFVMEAYKIFFTFTFTCKNKCHLSNIQPKLNLNRSIKKKLKYDKEKCCDFFFTFFYEIAGFLNRHSF